ncbi:MAG: sulfatase-like hydrolase/transferase [bacterium]
MNALARLTLAPALAAIAIVAYEAVRALAFGATTVGTLGQILGLAAAVAGLLGLPLWIAGAVGIAGVFGLDAGWRWGRGPLPPMPAARRVALALYFALALAALVATTHVATLRFVKAFNKAVYQGLGAGLVAAATVLVLAALAGPIVGALARLVDRLSQKLPPVIDPTRPRAAALWIVLLLVLGAILAPIVVPPLHTVDLRPARLMLGWALALALAVWWTTRAPRRWPHAAAGAAAALVFLGCFVWSAYTLGDSQRRRLALDRDTVLAGPLAAQLGRLGDADGDGVPSTFAGGDCDDTDPAIRPGVYDPPDDGIDQNCTGSDLIRAQDPIRRPERDAPGPRRDLNVVLLTIDALRDDAVARDMKRLQQLADQNINFVNAYSHGAATYWSIPALLASTLPSRLEMGRDQTPVPRMVLLPEVLRDAGWHTALFANVTVFFVRGLRQGAIVADYETSHYTVHGAKPGSAHLTSSVLAHIDRWQQGELEPQRERFFVWAHYYDPHDPYFEVEGHPAEDGSDHARYRAITRYLDTELGRLFDGLRARGLWDDTVIVITADHGDEFGDHGHRFHGRTLYEEMVHVPLILRVPGVEARALPTPIGQMELAPTLLDLLGVPIPRDWIGRSRADELRTGQRAPIEPVFFEVFPDSNYDAHQVGMRLGDLKLIYRLDQNYFELYDLAADPLERDNVYDLHPDAPALRDELMVYLDHHLDQLARNKTGARLPPGAPDPKQAPTKRPARPKPAPRPRPAP